MQISDNTIDILSNFSAINPSIIIPAGNEIKTVSAGSKAIFATAKVTETFPEKMVIYNLSSFLMALGLFKSKELTPNEKYVEIGNSSESVKFYYAEQSVLKSIVSAEELNFDFPKDFIDIKISKDTISKLQKATSILGNTYIALSGNGKKIWCLTTNINNDSGNNYKQHIGDSEHKFNILIKKEHFSMLMIKDYTISIPFKSLVVRFKTDDLTYYIAPDKASTAITVK